MPDEQQPESPGDGTESVTDAEAPTPEAASDNGDAADAAKATGAAADAATKPAAKPASKTGAKTGNKAGTKGEDKTGQTAGGSLFSVYGLVSTVLGLVAVAALVFGLITWSTHRDDVNERNYRSRVLQTAASWTSVLINLNAENVDKGMQRLHDKTVGQLNGEFESAVAPYREVVQRIKSRSTGRIEAVAIESTPYRAGDEGSSSADKAPVPGAGRTDPVVVIATSIAENVGGKPQTVHWALQLDVTDVDGRMLISQLRSIR